MTPVVSEEGLFNSAPWHSSLETDTMRASDGERVDEMIVLFFLYVTVTGTTRRTMAAARTQQQVNTTAPFPPEPLWM